MTQHLMDFLTNHLPGEDKAYPWSVGSFWATSRTTGRGCLAAAEHHSEVTAEAAAPFGGAASAKGRPQGAPLNHYLVPDWVPVPSAAWVHQQVCPHPYPKRLMLRNHV